MLVSGFCVYPQSDPRDRPSSRRPTPNTSDVSRPTAGQSGPVGSRSWRRIPTCLRSLGLSRGFASSVQNKSGLSQGLAGNGALLIGAKLTCQAGRRYVRVCPLPDMRLTVFRRNYPTVRTKAELASMAMQTRLALSRLGSLASVGFNVLSLQLQGSPCQFSAWDTHSGRGILCLSSMGARFRKS